MYTANQSPDYHKCRKQTTQSIDCFSDFHIFNQLVKLYHGSRQNTHSQHGGGGWVRCFQNAVYQNRAAIDYMELKKYICAENKDVKYAKNQDAAVNLADALSLYPLHKPKDSKTESNEYCCHARPIGDVVQSHVDSKQLMDGMVDTCVGNGRPVWTDWLHIKKCQ